MILVISRSEDEHTRAVLEFLTFRGSAHRCIWTDQIAERPSTITAGFPETGRIQIGGAEHDARSIGSVFVHFPRIDVPENLPRDALDRELVIAGWLNAFEWLEKHLSTAQWVNRPSAFQRSSGTALQLAVAAQHGLRVPRTIFTNDIEKVREFAQNCPCGIVLKPGPLPGVRLRKTRILTQLVTPESILPTTLSRSPCLFQEYVEKAYELRVHVVGEKVLTCKIESQAGASTRVDWRNYDLTRTPHWPLDLAPSVSGACVNIVRDLGLRMGVLDLVVTPDGQHVFLECNVQANWLWIEQFTGLEITRAICDLLDGG